ncbi:hypothetical protein BSF41_42340 [Flavobacterium sp. ACN2]|jgi:hypothetical protein|uniref:glycosyltransferase family 2 protein n=1 Tax=Flavobacterium sp. ACN2 TaxID=1975676 RepID=UPI000BB317B7|nr:hypothetical protein [Flavobacterium sp. ACN2]PBI84135.1 hypothetical protein BSF41_42340 [Flavobacterium sp. ACN2]
MEKLEDNIVINVLTRTSNRPIGFKNLKYSLNNQTYKIIRHIVSYDNDVDLNYLNQYDVEKVKVNSDIREEKNHPDGFTPAYYNLYCNELLDKVTDGWIVFLDDDVNLFHHKVFEEIISHIKKNDNDTMFFWQIRFPNKVILPDNRRVKKGMIEIYNIDTACFLFHSKYKNKVRWDGWKVSDYRVINSLSKIIPKQKWINQVYVQINNQGDLGNKNDIKKNSVNKFVFFKTFFWHFIPKYHYQIFGLYLFKSDFLKQFGIKFKQSIRYKIKILVRYLKLKN